MSDVMRCPKCKGGGKTYYLVEPGGKKTPVELPDKARAKQQTMPRRGYVFDTCMECKGAGQIKIGESK
jgi:RecJ-like exonuclease